MEEANSGQEWGNCQVRVFEFGPGDIDPDLIEITQETGTVNPTMTAPAPTLSKVSDMSLLTPEEG